MTTPDPAHNIDAFCAAREWAAEHVHPQPDDRMLKAYGRVLLDAAHHRLDDARQVVRRLVHMEREHLGTGRDGHLSERDLAPLLHALHIDPRGDRTMSTDRQMYAGDDDPAESRRYLSGACWAGNCGECTDRACEHNCGHEAADRGQPGDGCKDPRDLHRHRCDACGFEMTSSRAKCRALPVVPHCEMCGASEWRYEVDYLDGFQP